MSPSNFLKKSLNDLFIDPGVCIHRMIVIIIAMRIPHAARTETFGGPNRQNRQGKDLLGGLRKFARYFWKSFNCEKSYLKNQENQRKAKKNLRKTNKNVFFLICVCSFLCLDPRDIRAWILISEYLSLRSARAKRARSVPEGPLVNPSYSYTLVAK